MTEDQVSKVQATLEDGFAKMRGSDSAGENFSTSRGRAFGFSADQQQYGIAREHWKEANRFERSKS